MFKQLKKIVVISVATISALGSNALADDANKKIYKIKMATTWSPSLTQFTDSIDRFIKRVETLSDGQIQIEVHDATKTKSPFGVLDFVKSGQYQLGSTSAYYYKGKDPNLMPFTTMPFGMDPTEQLSWFYNGGGLELMQKAFAPHKMYAFPGGNTGVQMSGWFKKEIKTVDDLKGLKMRIPGFAGEIMSRLGVVVTNVPSGELYTSLDRGLLDAAEWVAPAMDMEIGFPKIADYYYTAWNEPSGEISYFVNQKFYDSLPPKLQQLLVDSIRLTSYDMLINNYHLNAFALAELQKKYPNVKIKTLPIEIINKLKEINEELKAEYASKNPLLKEILDSQDKYQKTVRAWTEVSEYLYLKDNLTTK